jgi:hypothetical protein
MSSISRRELLKYAGAAALIGSLPRFAFGQSGARPSVLQQNDLNELFAEDEIRHSVLSCLPWRPEVDMDLAARRSSIPRIWADNGVLHAQYLFPSLGGAALLYEVHLGALDPSSIFVSSGSDEDSHPRITIRTMNQEDRVVVRRSNGAMPIRWRLSDQYWNSITPQSYICVYAARPDCAPHLEALLREAIAKSRSAA